MAVAGRSFLDGRASEWFLAAKSCQFVARPPRQIEQEKQFGGFCLNLVTSGFCTNSRSSKRKFAAWTFMAAEAKLANSSPIRIKVNSSLFSNHQTPGKILLYVSMISCFPFPFVFIHGAGQFLRISFRAKMR